MNKNIHSNNILLNLGIESLNKMQVAAETSILIDSDVVLLSPTGSGKTLAFLLPIFHDIFIYTYKISTLFTFANIPIKITLRLNLWSPHAIPMP